MNEERVAISVKIPKSKHAALEQLAKETGLLKSNLIRNWIYKGLEGAKP